MTKDEVITKFLGRLMYENISFYINKIRNFIGTEEIEYICNEDLSKDIWEIDFEETCIMAYIKGELEDTIHYDIFNQNDLDYFISLITNSIHNCC